MRKISVIVPVYNTEKYLNKCFDSLVNQTYSDFKVIVVNDGSTDKSMDIINRYDKEYDGLFKVYSVSNGGRANARNIGLNHVKTDYFMFLDSDDYLDENTLLLFMQEMDKNTDVLVCNAIRIVDGIEKNVFKLYKNDIDDKNKALILSQPGPCGKLYRTSIFRDNKLFFPENIRLYEDLGVIPLVGLYTNRVKYIDKPLYKYVIHENSALRQTRFNPQMNDIFTIMDILSSKFNNKYKEELEYLYIENLLRSASLRYSSYKEGYEYVIKISDIMNHKYPNYRKNKYYKKVNYRFKLICILAYHKQIWLLRLLNKLNSKRK